MKKKNMKTLIITSILCLVPIAIGLVLYDQLPDQIATHFASDGEPNGYSSKLFTVFGLPLILLGINLLVNFGVSTDPKNNYNQNPIMYNFGKWACPVIGIVMMNAIYYIALGNDLNMSFIVTLGIGLLFVLIGNYFPKCKQNFTIGIKLPWTLNNERNWNLTHRFAGFIWMIGGIVLIISSFIDPSYSSTFFITIILVMVLVPFVYSYMLYRKGI